MFQILWGESFRGFDRIDQLGIIKSDKGQNDNTLRGGSEGYLFQWTKSNLLAVTTSLFQPELKMANISIQISPSKFKTPQVVFDSALYV